MVKVGFSIEFATGGCGLTATGELTLSHRRKQKKPTCGNTPEVFLHVGLLINAPTAAAPIGPIGLRFI